MDELITGFVGLDAHAESTAIGFAEAGRAAPSLIGTVGPKRSELTKVLGRLGEPQSLLIVYEAGPCGYGLARELGALGYRCEVVAPSKIPQKAGELTSVTIPDERDEAIRDLCRARVDAVRARLQARQRAGLAVPGELDGSPDAFYQRTRMRLEQLDSKLLEWGNSGDAAKVVTTLRARTQEICRKLPANDPGRRNCERFLHTAAQSPQSA